MLTSTERVLSRNVPVSEVFITPAFVADFCISPDRSRCYCEASEKKQRVWLLQRVLPSIPAAEARNGDQPQDVYEVCYHYNFNHLNPPSWLKGVANNLICPACTKAWPAPPAKTVSVCKTTTVTKTQTRTTTAAGATTTIIASVTPTANTVTVFISTTLILADYITVTPIITVCIPQHTP